MSGLELPDPFEVIGEIPKDRAYQWIAISVWGSEELARADWVIRKGGWEAVPPDRHPEMPRVGGRIEYGGCVLMERDAILNDAVVRKEQAKAYQQKEQWERVYGITRPEGEPIGSIAPVTTPRAYEQAAEPLILNVTIPLQLPADLVTAASVCAVTPEEYARRVIALMLEGRLCYLLLQSEDGKAFELFDRLTVARPDRGNTYE